MATEILESAETVFCGIHSDYVASAECIECDLHLVPIAFAHTVATIAN